MNCRWCDLEMAPGQDVCGTCGLSQRIHTRPQPDLRAEARAELARRAPLLLAGAAVLVVAWLAWPHLARVDFAGAARSLRKSLTPVASAPATPSPQPAPTPPPAEPAPPNVYAPAAASEPAPTPPTPPAPFAPSAPTTPAAATTPTASATPAASATAAMPSAPSAPQLGVGESARGVASPASSRFDPAPSEAEEGPAPLPDAGPQFPPPHVFQPQASGVSVEVQRQTQPVQPVQGGFGGPGGGTASEPALPPTTIVQPSTSRVRPTVSRRGTGAASPSSGRGYGAPSRSIRRFYRGN